MIISGASSGFGGMAARALADAGHRVYAGVRGTTGRNAEATPDDLSEVIERLVAERDTARKIADAGPSFVRDLHDGRKSVAELLPFLNNELVYEDESE